MNGNVIESLEIVEDQFAASPGATSFPPASQPFPPSFPFVGPQVGARTLPIATSDAQVMPASNGTGLYYKTDTAELRMWIRASGWWITLDGIAAMPGGEDISTLVLTGVYVWTNVAPAHSYPNPASPPVDPRHSVLEVWNLNPGESVVGPAGYAVQRFISAADWQNGRFFIRTYSDIGHTGTFSWTAWKQFTSTADVPAAP
jgi:hypothetical protein